MPAMRAQPTRLVFIDETSVKTNLTRLRGRCPRGERLEMNAPFGAWGTQTFIAGLTTRASLRPGSSKGQWMGRLSQPTSARCWLRSWSPVPW
ncbi:hypothetical protein [Tateyamaria sp.]|uniref:hypothetical protein n=1 Tax=Tateyamaria sp. TaxID=1929288 RepID=UPI003B2259AA